MRKIELKNFHNQGFGWACRVCEKALKTGSEEKSRLLREGEAENKNPVLSNRALAGWRDERQTELICRRCGLTETVI
jgi:hypothetical protein